MSSVAAENKAIEKKMDEEAQGLLKVRYGTGGSAAAEEAPCSRQGSVTFLHSTPQNAEIFPSTVASKYEPGQPAGDA